MGIVVVLLLYAAVLSALACVSAAILWAVTYFLTKGVRVHRKKVLTCAALLPFFCVGYAGAWFIAYAVINYGVFHRDPMLGDTWETPLPNGYALMMIDVTDEGTVYNPRTQSGYDSVMGSNDTEFGVRQLQVAGPLIFGASDSGYFERIGKANRPDLVDTYFEIDTHKNSRVEFKSLEELRQRAGNEGVSLHFLEFASVYQEYRFTWFDYTAFAILLLIPGIVFLFFIWWVWKIREAAV